MRRMKKTLGFYQDLSERTKEELSLFPRCRLEIGAGGYFENVKSIGDFSKEKLVLYFSKNALEIQGQNFVIGKFYDGDLQLLGRIESVKLLTFEKDGIAP